MLYYGENKTQSQIVTDVYGSSVNEGGSEYIIWDVLDFNNVSSTIVYNYLSFTGIRTQIYTRSAPVIAIRELMNGMRHAVVVCGYDIDFVNCVQYMDPETGQKYYDEYNTFRATWDSSITGMSHMN